LSRRLLPLIPAGLSVVQVLPAPNNVTIIAACKTSRCACPLCGHVSGRVHSHYTRTLADLPWQGRPVILQVRARRFRCGRVDCPRQVFTERRPAVAHARARRTTRLGGLQCQIGFALGGEPGARLAVRLAMPASGDTVLRLIHRAEPKPSPSPRVVAIDDWAWRRGQRYGTIICDLERGEVVDLLPDRSTETVAGWLRRHPSIEVVARNRAGAYAEAARQGAPAAKQVADRWHLLRNLGDALQGAVDRRRDGVRQAARAVGREQSSGAGEAKPAAVVTKETRRRAERRERRQARYEELQRLHASGMTVGEIAPALGMSAVAAYRWLKAGRPPSHDKPAQPRPLDPYVAHLEARWRDGCHNGRQLWRELQVQGFTGAVNAVARWVARRRRDGPPLQAAEIHHAAAWPAPSSRRCARLLTTPVEKRDAAERLFLLHLAETAPDLVRAGELATEFAALVRDKSGQDQEIKLDAWTACAGGTMLDAFARGIGRDRDAVLAALVERWSTSPAEGQINRLKLLKRMMYGRASYGLLRRRVLAA